MKRLMIAVVIAAIATMGAMAQTKTVKINPPANDQKKQTQTTQPQTSPTTPTTQTTQTQKAPNTQTNQAQKAPDKKPQENKEAKPKQNPNSGQMYTYVVIATHQPEQCNDVAVALKAKDQNNPNRFWFGCKSGDHTVYGYVRAKDEAAVRAMLPDIVLSTAKIVKVDRMNPSQVQNKQATETEKNKGKKEPDKNKANTTPEKKSDAAPPVKVIKK